MNEARKRDMGREREITRGNMRKKQRNNTRLIKRKRNNTQREAGITIYREKERARERGT